MSDRLDDAIDRAVREMLDVEPRADLRARVIARLPASGSRLPAAGFRLPAFGSLSMLVASAFRRNRVVFAAAAAAILLAIVVARRTAPLPQAPVVARGPDRTVVPATPLRQPAIDTQPSRVTQPIVRTTRRVPRAASAGTIVAAVAAEGNATTAIVPLQRIAPIEVAAIVQQNIAPAEIAVRPLNTITEVQIAPLTPPDRR
jgi:hypothetical protein